MQAYAKNVLLSTLNLSLVHVEQLLSSLQLFVELLPQNAEMFVTRKWNVVIIADSYATMANADATKKSKFCVDVEGRK